MTYREAKQKANEKNINVLYRGDAGNNCEFEVYYCPARKKQIWATVTKNGVRIH